MSSQTHHVEDWALTLLLKLLNKFVTCIVATCIASPPKRTVVLILRTAKDLLRKCRLTDSSLVNKLSTAPSVHLKRSTKGSWPHLRTVTLLPARSLFWR